MISKKYKAGIAFGTFSLLHYGHIRLLKRAKEYCEILYAITESNDIIEKEKGYSPNISEADRVEDLLGVKYVDEVRIRTRGFDRKYWCDNLKPDVLFLGSDWENKDWEGKHFGVPIIYLPRTKEISSTLIRNLPS